MATPSKADVTSAMRTIFKAISYNHADQSSRQAYNDLLAVASRLEVMDSSTYSGLIADAPFRSARWGVKGYDLDVTLNDSTDAGVAEAIAATGELGVANGGVAVSVGMTFRVADTADFTDNALATAKTGAVAANDVFEVTGADAVAYRGSWS